jgi:hypothetical protein
MLEPMWGVAVADQAKVTADDVLVQGDGKGTFLIYFRKGVDPQASIAIKDVPAGMTLSAAWFDPRTGKTQPGEAAMAPRDGRLALPNRPDDQDWMLIVKPAGPK